MTADPVAAILVAAGRSRRMGHDKLWTDFWGRPTWRWSLDTLLACRAVSRVAIAVAPDAIEYFRAALPAGAGDRCLVVAGGEARADSVIAGLLALTEAGHSDETIVLVHDAARPALTVELVEAVAAAAAPKRGRSCRWSRSSIRSSGCVAGGWSHRSSARRSPRRRRRRPRA